MAVCNLIGRWWRWNVRHVAGLMNFISLIIHDFDRVLCGLLFGLEFHHIINVILRAYDFLGGTSKRVKLFRRIVR